MALQNSSWKNTLIFFMKPQRFQSYHCGREMHMVPARFPTEDKVSLRRRSPQCEMEGSWSCLVKRGPYATISMLKICVAASLGHSMQESPGPYDVGTGIGTSTKSILEILSGLASRSGDEGETPSASCATIRRGRKYPIQRSVSRGCGLAAKS